MSKTAVVIGASRGIGLGLVRELASRGYSVIGTQRGSSDLDEAASSSEAIRAVECDVTDSRSVENVRQALGGEAIDLLIVNAGVYGGREQALSDLTRDNIADIMMTNAVGPVQTALALLPSMKEGGTIGLMTSQMGSIDDSSGGSNLYRLSKVSQNMLSRSLFEQHAKEKGVGVLSLHPGWVQTDMGGSNAPTSVDDSVRGLSDVLEAETKPRHAFVAYDGRELPW